MAYFSTAASAWTLLLVAGLLEVVWSTSMKASDGFTKHIYTGITLGAAWLSFWLLGLAMKSLPLGTAYAVWTGIGAVGAAVLGMLLFQRASNVRTNCVHRSDRWWNPWPEVAALAWFQWGVALLATQAVELTRCGLTGRSTGAPTAGHLARLTLR